MTNPAKRKRNDPVGTRGHKDVLQYRPAPTILQYVCDDRRHLICLPYSVANLHRMAANLGLDRCWFHGSNTSYSHYDIPVRRMTEIMAQCQIVTTKEMIRMLRAHLSETVRARVGTGYQGVCR